MILFFFFSKGKKNILFNISFTCVCVCFFRFHFAGLPSMLYMSFPCTYYFQVKGKQDDEQKIPPLALLRAVCSAIATATLENSFR